MLRFTTLGATGFANTDGTASGHRILAQPKRLAVFAYLVVAHPGTLVFRDALLALFWPEHDTVHARHALRQTLYHLRLELGSALILGRDRGAVGVDPDVIWCDALAFDRALERGDPAAALALYRGDFLAGFHAGCSARFDRWLESVRDRLRHSAAGAALAQLDLAEAADDCDMALRHARWLADLLPYDEQVHRRLVLLLLRTGDRAGALAAHHALTARLEHDLELLPTPDAHALEEALRRGAASMPTN